MSKGLRVCKCKSNAAENLINASTCEQEVGKSGGVGARRSISSFFSIANDLSDKRYSKHENVKNEYICSIGML
jgi:hypothetical protein